MQMYMLIDPLIPKLVRERLHRRLSNMVPFDAIVERIIGLGYEYSIVGSIMLSTLLGEQWEHDTKDVDMFVRGASSLDDLMEGLETIFGTYNNRGMIGGMYTCISQMNCLGAGRKPKPTRFFPWTIHIEIYADPYIEGAFQDYESDEWHVLKPLHVLARTRYVSKG